MFTIGIVTMWYNEEFLAPFFLRHYNYLDRIHILLDTDTTDSTREICSEYPNVEIENFTFPDMMNDFIKADKITETVAKMDSDWVYAVDADEFIFPLMFEDPYQILDRQPENVGVLFAKMWQVYRHVDDKDLDSNNPVILQRRHGDTNTTEGLNRLYNKPIIVRPEIQVAWRPGCHFCGTKRNVVASEDYFVGAHWAMADVDMAIKRRIKGRRDRQSKINLLTKTTVHQHDITEEKIREECEQHLYDPRLF